MPYSPVGPYGTFNPPAIPDPNLVALKSNLLTPKMPSYQPVRGSKRQSLWDKIQQVVSPYPDHLAGLVGERDVQSARNQGLLAAGASLLEAGGPSPVPVGMGQALGRGITAGMGAYQGGIDRLTQGAAARQELDMNRMKMEEFKKNQERMEQISAKRQALLQAYPMPDTANMDDMEHWIAQTMPHFVEMGDEDTVRSLTEAYKTIAAHKGNRNVTDKIEAVVGPDGKPGYGYITPDGVKMIPGATPPPKGEGSKANPRPITLLNPETGKAEVALFNPESGNFDFTGQIPVSIGAGSESERKNQAIYELAAPHVALLDEATSPNRIQQAVINGKLNELLSENRQMWDVSGRQMADAYLRLTTGAAYNKEELEMATIMMTPRPGDTPKVIALKAENRKRLLNALRAAAGRSFNEAAPSAFAPNGGAGPAAAPGAGAGGVRGAIGGVRK